MRTKFLFPLLALAAVTVSFAQTLETKPAGPQFEKFKLIKAPQPAGL